MPECGRRREFTSGMRFKPGADYKGENYVLPASVYICNKLARGEKFLYIISLIHFLVFSAYSHVETHEYIVRQQKSYKRPEDTASGEENGT